MDEEHSVKEIEGGDYEEVVLPIWSELSAVLGVIGEGGRTYCYHGLGGVPGNRQVG